MVSQLFPRLKLVVLDCPIETWDSPQTRELFVQIVALKLGGYGKEYPAGVISLDGHDFIGTHLCVCQESEKQGQSGQLDLLVAYRSVLLSRCEFYRMGFPPLTILKTSHCGKQMPWVQSVIERAKNRGEISYDSSWTRKPSIQWTKEMSSAMREMISTFCVFYHQKRSDSIPEWITCGVHKFKTNEYFEKMGGTKIAGPFAQWSLGGPDVSMYHMSEFAEEVKQTAERNRDLWENRLVIASPERLQKKAA